MGEEHDRARMPLAVGAWFGCAFALLAITGLLLGRIVQFVDFSERAPFSVLGIFMMLELALLLFAITVALQRKRVAHRLAIAIGFLAVPVLAGLPPALLEFPAEAANGWYLVTVPLGALITLAVTVGLLRPAARAWFSED